MLRMMITAAALLAALAACAAPASPPQEVGPVVKQAGEQPGEAWQSRWNQVVQGAKKEGTVVVYGAATGEIREALIKAFTGKYGIAVEYLAVKGPEIAAKVLAERRAGLYLPDVIIGASGPSVTVLKPAGVFDPMEPALLLPEITDQKVWWQNRIPWVDKERHFIAFLAFVDHKMEINTDLVKPEQIKSYRDILDPKWKGKMVMHDPTLAGSGKMFVDVQANVIMGVDYLRQLAKQDPFISRDQRLLAEWLARGKYPVGIAIDQGNIQEMLSAGAPIQYVVAAEGTYVSAGTGFLSRPRNAPHPNASLLFINWLLSREGQIAYTDVANLQSARADIPSTNVDPVSMRKPGVKYVDTTTEEFYLRTDAAIALGREIFGHLLK
ncbi:MAG: extracellular solute-binding protein [Chloroflexi bacterium]|nr:extracellular solute-binding protein [Chloroflexota bacterium]